MLEQEGCLELPTDGYNERQHCKSCREAYPNEYKLAEHMELNHVGQWCGFDHEHNYVRVLPRSNPGQGLHQGSSTLQLIGGMTTKRLLAANLFLGRQHRTFRHPDLGVSLVQRT